MQSTFQKCLTFMHFQAHQFTIDFAVQMKSPKSPCCCHSCSSFTSWNRTLSNGQPPSLSKLPWIFLGARHIQGNLRVLNLSPLFKHLSSLWSVSFSHNIPHWWFCNSMCRQVFPSCGWSFDISYVKDSPLIFTLTIKNQQLYQGGRCYSNTLYFI